ncbi:hypothetical protein CDD80_135 [Ophiocordyceps camponoti-rufipedis]|uniref:RING-type E3 ubiquitin transferase n=1 Tax=Ophiocordyceps camponoti-rufipedis TaxID=2004952 RepID=A0A2C5Z7N7_9HYPO|nr:hypothetical protein CDD80_135 [Ophiocordyceps camponoti-rufipedis]
MFSQPLSSPSPGPPPGASVARSSRLRGLSYLRNYTHSHLLSREGASSSSTSTSSSSSARAPANLARSASYTLASTMTPATATATATAAATTTTTTTTTTTAAAAANQHRLTLVDSMPDTAFQRRAADAIPEVLPEIDADACSSPPLSSPPPSSHQTSTTAMPAAREAGSDAAAMPSIRFSAYYDPRSARPSLSFVPVSRTLPNAGEVIRVGRYSERDGQATAPSTNQPSSAPVGFKSKVVSRRHCEFWCEDGKWFIKDVKSSSGTFLNHIRLSPPSQESRAYPVNDGDIVQLGIDFKGGEEMIFRCVKMRLELNRGWQNKLNTFNVAAHKRLRIMASNSGASSLSSSNSQDCSICLNSIAPCQSLFVAPCSHTWHFKCVRSLLMSPQYPIFVCPNCRAGADLEADVDEPTEDWQQLDAAVQHDQQPQQASTPEAVSPPELADITVQDADAMDMTVNVDGPSPVARNTLLNPFSSPLPINGSSLGAGRVSRLREDGSVPPGVQGEGPITPRNNAGPWVFDGSAGCSPVDASAEDVASLGAIPETSGGAPKEGPLR